MSTGGTGVSEVCWASWPCKTPRPTLVFICPPAPLPSRRSKGKRLFWFRVTAELPWTPGLPSAHAIPGGPTRSLARITCPWPALGGRGTSVPAVPTPPTLTTTTTTNTTAFTHPPPPPPPAPSQVLSNYYYRLYKGLTADQRTAVTSIGGWSGLRGWGGGGMWWWWGWTVKGAVWHGDRTRRWQRTSDSSATSIRPFSTHQIRYQTVEQTICYPTSFSKMPERNVTSPSQHFIWQRCP